MIWHIDPRSICHQLRAEYFRQFAATHLEVWQWPRSYTDEEIFSVNENTTKVTGYRRKQCPEE